MNGIDLHYLVKRHLAGARSGAIGRVGWPSRLASASEPGMKRLAGTVNAHDMRAHLGFRERDRGTHLSWTPMCAERNRPVDAATGRAGAKEAPQ